MGGPRRFAHFLRAEQMSNPVSPLCNCRLHFSFPPNSEGSCKKQTNKQTTNRKKKTIPGRGERENAYIHGINNKGENPVGQDATGRRELGSKCRISSSQFTSTRWHTSYPAACCSFPYTPQSYHSPDKRFDKTPARLYPCTRSSRTWSNVGSVSSPTTLPWTRQ